MDLLDRIREFIARHELATGGARVVAAVSGGSDSVALACLLNELDSTGELKLVGLAHFNHQLRQAADADEAFCLQLAQSLQRPIWIDREDVASRARRDRQSIETAARAARHAFLEQARVRYEADAVALGHTRDDQAETVLLRLVRGAGLRGLAAMHPKNGPLVRPLLSCRRVELREYLTARQISFVEDESNADVSIPRNRVRAELVPLLERRFNPRIVDVLADEAELIQDIMQWIEAEADKLLGAACRGGNNELDIEVLNAAPSAVKRFALWRALTRAASGRPVSFGHVRSALDVLRSPEDTAVDLPGQRLQRLGRVLVLTGRPAGVRGRGSRPAPLNLFEYPLSIPGEVALPDIGCTLSAERLPAGVDSPLRGGPAPREGSVAVVRADLGNGGPWCVRSRRPGDRFRPVGVVGRKKLQDFFVDRKVSRDLRDHIPIVVDGAGRIVWVAGYGIDEAFRVTDAAQAVVVLRLKVVGGPA